MRQNNAEPKLFQRTIEGDNNFQKHFILMERIPKERSVRFGKYNADWINVTPSQKRQQEFSLVIHLLPQGKIDLFFFDAHIYSFL